PTAVRIIDTAVQTALVEAQRVRNAHVDPLTRFRNQRDQRVGVGAGQDRDVLAETNHVVLIHPTEVVEVGRIVGVFEARTRGLVDGPGVVFTLGADVRAGAIRYALGAIEFGPLRSRSHGSPRRTVAGQVHTTRVQRAFRYLI